MIFLLGTRALAEVLQAEFSSGTGAAAWFDRLGSADKPFISVISIGELLSASEELSDAEQRRRWRERLEDTVPALFDGLILPVTEEIARRWATIRLALPIIASGDATASNANDRMFAEESLIIATAQVNGLAYVGEATPMLQSLGVPLVDPWRNVPV